MCHLVQAVKPMLLSQKRRINHHHRPGHILGAFRLGGVDRWADPEQAEATPQGLGNQEAAVRSPSSKGRTLMRPPGDDRPDRRGADHHGAERPRQESSDGKTAMVAMVVHGFDDDPRELHEIQVEVVAHMGRLVDFGFISVLTRSSTLPELGGFDTGAIYMFGAFEVWWFAGGMFAGGGTLAIPQSAVDHFRDVVYPAAGERLRANLRKYPHAVANPDLGFEQRLGS